MIKFIKNLLGFGAKESVQEILTPTEDKVLITRIAVPESNPSVVVKPVPKEGKVRANVKKPNPTAKKPPAPPAPKPKTKAKPAAKAKAKK